MGIKKHYYRCYIIDGVLEGSLVGIKLGIIVGALIGAKESVLVVALVADLMSEVEVLVKFIEVAKVRVLVDGRRCSSKEIPSK